MHNEFMTPGRLPATSSVITLSPQPLPLLAKPPGFPGGFFFFSAPLPSLTPMPLPPAPSKRAALLSPEAFSLKASEAAFEEAVAQAQPAA